MFTWEAWEVPSADVISASFGQPAEDINLARILARILDIIRDVMAVLDTIDSLMTPPLRSVDHDLVEAIIASARLHRLSNSSLGSPNLSTSTSLEDTPFPAVQASSAPPMQEAPLLPPVTPIRSLWDVTVAAHSAMDTCASDLSDIVEDVDASPFRSNVVLAGITAAFALLVVVLRSTICAPFRLQVSQNDLLSPVTLLVPDV